MAAAGYRRVAAESSPAAWVFAGTGVPDGGDFGAYGVMGGAAGIEVDAVDPELGTPESAILLATSIGHGPAMIEARENFNMTHTALGDGGDNEISRILGNVIDRFAAAGPVLD